MSRLVPPPDMVDSVSNPRQPFGLPLGTVRAFLSLLICGFFWVVLLWPAGKPAPEPLLAHYFMLMLVILTFSPYSSAAVSDSGSQLIPRLLRFLVVAGTIGIVALAWARLGNPNELRMRVTPNGDEVEAWWVPYLLTTAGGFAVGLFLRLLFGRDNPIYQTLRAWLSVLGMLFLLGEIVFWVAVAGADYKPDIHVFQAFNLGIIAAYFGTRA